MKLYHGTKCRNIAKFDFDHSRSDIDFGKGVYFTPDFKQAMEWSCKHKTTTGAVYECDLDISGLKTMIFKSDEEDLLYLVYLCRIGLEEIVPDSVDNFENTDIVIGLMLKDIDDFEDLAEEFNEGEKEYAEYSTLVNFWTEKAAQVCIKSTAALEKINASIRKVHYTKKEHGKIKVESVKSVDTKEE